LLNSSLWFAGLPNICDRLVMAGSESNGLTQTVQPTEQDVIAEEREVKIQQVSAIVKEKIIQRVLCHLFLTRNVVNPLPNFDDVADLLASKEEVRAIMSGRTEADIAHALKGADWKNFLQGSLKALTLKLQACFDVHKCYYTERAHKGFGDVLEAVQNEFKLLVRDNTDDQVEYANRIRFLFHCYHLTLEVAHGDTTDSPSSSSTADEPLTTDDSLMATDESIQTATSDSDVEGGTESDEVVGHSGQPEGDSGESFDYATREIFRSCLSRKRGRRTNDDSRGASTRPRLAQCE